MPYIPEHAPKVSARSVYPCARDCLRERIQLDRQMEGEEGGEEEIMGGVLTLL